MNLTSEEIREQRFLEDVEKLERFATKKKSKGSKQLERWFAYSKKGSVICPICLKLDSLGWVDFGLLPAFKKAHSVIGEGRWKSPDSDCNCKKGYKRVAGEAPEKVIPISGYDGPNSIKKPKLKFDKEFYLKFNEQPKYTKEEALKIIEDMKIEFKNINCTCE
jgi:hypothetical protein